jgi:hypothetical protein
MPGPNKQQKLSAAQQLLLQDVVSSDYDDYNSSSYHSYRDIEAGVIAAPAKQLPNNSQSLSAWLKKWAPELAGAGATLLSFVAVGGAMWVLSDNKDKRSVEETCGKAAIDVFISVSCGMFTYGTARFFAKPAAPKIEESQPAAEQTIPVVLRGMHNLYNK